MHDTNALLADLGRRLWKLETIREIEQLKYRYLRACDAKDIAGFRACFVQGEVDLDYGVIGRYTDAGALAAVFGQIARSQQDGRWLVHDMHHAHHPSIDIVDEQTAEGRWTLGFLTLHVNAGIFSQASMEYTDRYVIEDGQWRIQRSHVRVLTSVTSSLPPNLVLGDGPPA
jgi:hypothetical protein